jgi:hypothetical protein
MKALVVYDDKKFLVETNNDGSVNYQDLFQQYNKDRWPDECHLMDWFKENGRIVAYFTNESQIVDN